MDTRLLTDSELRDPNVDAVTVQPDMAQVEDDCTDGPPVVIALVAGWFGTLIVLGVYVLLRLAGVL